MIKVNHALAGVTRLGFDTPPIIYFVEAHPRYDALVTDIFQRIEQAALVGITSAISLSEVLVQPLLHGNRVLAQSYRDILLNSAHFQTLPIDAILAERAADLRARYRLRTPDALQLAAALHTNCEAFLTNDSQLRRITELQILILDELEL